jgi:hypothetical protein
LARRTDSNSPADWLFIARGDLEGVRELAERYFTDRYPGFDLEDEDWPRLRHQADQIAGLLETVNKRIGASPTVP